VSRLRASSIRTTGSREHCGALATAKMVTLYIQESSRKDRGVSIQNGSSKMELYIKGISGLRFNGHGQSGIRELDSGVHGVHVCYSFDRAAKLVAGQ
jgi:hypothetical protein